MTAESAYRYKAFISYSHSDEKWASWLHRSLETYRVPKRLVGEATPMGVIPKRLAPVFRDREELASSTDLGADLRSALEGSACQIVICSRAAATSHWVNEEILAFKRLGRADRIFCLIVDGEPYASRTPGSEADECFPLALQYQLGADGELSATPAEPIAADARPGKDGKAHAKVKLLAGMLGVGFDALRQREQQRRNRHLAAVAAFSFVGMVFAIGLATTAVIARNEADQQRLRAESEAETARQTAAFMISLFKVADPGEARGQSITAREILTAGADRIETELASQPEVQARLMTTIGNVYKNLGLYTDARSMHAAALSRRRQLASIDDVELSRSLLGLASVLTVRAELEDAESLYLESLQRLEVAGATHGDEMDDSLAGLAEVYFRMGRFSDAEPLLERVLANRRARLGEEHPAAVDALEELGLNQFDQGKFEAAEDLMRQALAERREVLGEAPHPDVAGNLNNLAILLMQSERFVESEALFREAMAMNRRLHGDQHPDIATGLNNLGLLYRSQGRLPQAEAAYSEALAMRRQLLGPEHPEIAQVLVNLALSFYDQGDMAEAISHNRDALAIQTKALGERHPEVAATLSMLGRFLAEDGQRVEAEEKLRAALALYEGLIDPQHPDIAIAEMGLADLLVGEGERLTEASALANASRDKLARALGEEHWITAVSTSVAGAALSQLERFEDAEPLLLQSYQQLRDASSTRPVYLRAALGRVVDLYTKWGKLEAAGHYRDLQATLAAP